MGWKVRTIVNYLDSPENWSDWQGSIVWNSGTRLLPTGQAVERVEQMLRLARCFAVDEKVLWAKRIDSTLRGHIVSETEVILDRLPHVSCAVVLAAYPSSGRVVREGVLYVHGVPVNETETGNDPFTPVREACVYRVFREQSRRPVYHLPLDLVGKVGTRVHIKRLIEQGERPILVCDAVRDVDVIKWADIFASLSYPILPVDPGPFTLAYVSAKQRKNRNVLVVSGSLMPTAVNQLDTFEDVCNVRLVRVDVQKLLRTNYLHGASLDNVAAQVLRGLETGNVVGFRTDVSNTSPPRHDTSTARIIALLAVKILSRNKFHGLYASGGEVAYETLTALGARTLEPLAQVCPMGVLSRVIDGPYAGLYVVTKGGAVGPHTAVVDSVRLLLSKRDENTVCTGGSAI